MRRYARFAVSFLSLAALPLLAADLRSMKDPERIAEVFEKRASLRLLNVWATWCVPCVAEMPDLVAIDTMFGPELGVAGVSLDDMLPDATAKSTASFLDKLKVGYPNVYYTGNADALGEHLRFRGEIPLTVVYDARGRELWRHQGRIDREKTVAKLRELLRRDE